MRVRLHVTHRKVRKLVFLKFKRQHSADIFRELNAHDLKLVLDRLGQLVKGRVKIVFLFVPAGTAKCDILHVVLSSIDNHVTVQTCCD